MARKLRRPRRRTCIVARRSDLLDSPRPGHEPAWSWWYLLLAVPFVAMLWVSSYSSIQPELLGFPFFYWYQFLWVLISAVLTAVVYFATRRPGA